MIKYKHYNKLKPYLRIKKCYSGLGQFVKWQGSTEELERPSQYRVPTLDEFSRFIELQEFKRELAKKGENEIWNHGTAVQIEQSVRYWRKLETQLRQWLIHLQS